MWANFKQNFVIFRGWIIIKLPTNLRMKKLFHRNYIQDDHEGKEHWQFTIIDQCTNNTELSKKRGLLATSP